MKINVLIACAVSSLFPPIVVASTPTEFTVFGLPPDSLPDPSSYFSFLSEDFKNVTINFVQEARGIEIKGKHVVIEKGHANGLWERLNEENQGRIKSLTIYAETLDIKTDLDMPSASVTVYARNFRLNGRTVKLTPAANPNLVQGVGVNGADGNNAGKFELFVAIDSNQQDLRGQIDLQGGWGQDPSQGRDGASPPPALRTLGTYGSESIVATMRETCQTRNPFTGTCAIGGADQFNPSGRNRSNWCQPPVNGSDATPSGKPGRGGNGGIFTSTFDPGRYGLNVSVAGGSPGNPGQAMQGGAAQQPTRWACIRYQRDDGRAVRDAGGTTVAGKSTPATNNSAGSTGQMKLSFNNKAWANPTWIQQSIAHLKHSYKRGAPPDSVRQQIADLNSAIQAAFEGNQGSLVCLTVVGAVCTYKPQPGDPLFHLQAELNSISSRVESNLDFYGNPLGWVPALSFEVQYSVFEKEVVRSLEIITLAELVMHKGKYIEARKAAIDQIRTRLKQEYTDQVGKSNELVTRVNEANRELQQVLLRSDDLVQRLRQREQELLNVANRDLEQKKRDRQNIQVLAAVCKVFPLGQPALAYIGTTLDVATKVQSNDPWGAIMSLGTALASVPTDVSKTMEAWDKASKGLNTVQNAVDNASGVNALIEGAKAAQESYEPLIKEFDKVQKAMRPLQVPDHEVAAKLAELQASDTDFQVFFNEVQVLMEDKKRLSDVIAQVNQSILDIGASLQKNINQQYTLLRDKERLATADLAVMDVMSSLKDEAENRLELHHYNLKKAYEYRFLEEYPSGLDLTKVRTDVIRLIDTFRGETAVSTNSLLPPPSSNALLPLYQAELAKITDRIIGSMNAGNNIYRETSRPYRLTSDQLAALNRGEPLRLNLMQESLASSDAEGIRMLGVEVDSVKLQAGSTPLNAFVDFKFAHNGQSAFEKDGQIYKFTHYAGPNNRKIEWRSTYSHSTNRISQSPVSTSTSSLLATLTGNRLGNTDFLTAPAMWSDLTVTVDASHGQPVLENMVINVKYEFMTKRPNIATARVNARATGSASQLSPTITFSSTDLNGRNSGIGFISRSFTPYSTFMTTAPASYGRYAFVGWDTNGDGKADGQTATQTINLRSGQAATMTAIYNDAGTSHLSPSDNCVFSWAERTYPELFAPVGGRTISIHPYSGREYDGTKSSLTKSLNDQNLYYTGHLVPDGGFFNLGPVTQFISLSGCK